MDAARRHRQFAETGVRIADRLPRFQLALRRGHGILELGGVGMDAVAHLGDGAVDVGGHVVVGRRAPRQGQRAQERDADDDAEAGRHRPPPSNRVAPGVRAARTRAAISASSTSSTRETSYHPRSVISPSTGVGSPDSHRHAKTRSR